MVPGSNPEKELAKDPIPEPLVVLELNIVGVEVPLLQQMPLEVINEPPSPPIFPPEVAVVCITFSTGLVVISIGTLGIPVVNDFTSP